MNIKGRLINIMNEKEFEEYVKEIDKQIESLQSINKAMENLDASTINYRKSPETIIIEQIEKEREKEGEFWATHSAEECVKKSMEDAKKIDEFAKSIGQTVVSFDNDEDK